jgi:hypothetical protein
MKELGVELMPQDFLASLAALVQVEQKKPEGNYQNYDRQ